MPLAVGHHAGHQHGRQRPHPVMRPRHRRHHEPEHRHTDQCQHGLVGAQYPSHRPHRQPEHREAGQRPQHEPLALAETQPGQARLRCSGWCSASRCRCGRCCARFRSSTARSPATPSAKPARVATTADVAVTSSARVSRRSRKYRRNTAGVSLRAIATPQQHAARPRRPAGHAVGDDKRHQHDVDLAEVEVRPDGFQVDRRPGATIAAASQHRRSHAGSQVVDVQMLRPHVQPGQHDHGRRDEQHQGGQRDRDACTR